jgi:hypothetical protein
MKLRSDRGSFFRQTPAFLRQTGEGIQLSKIFGLLSN